MNSHWENRTIADNKSPRNCGAKNVKFKTTCCGRPKNIICTERFGVALNELLGNTSIVVTKLSELLILHGNKKQTKVSKSSILYNNLLLKNNYSNDTRHLVTPGTISVFPKLV